MCQTLLGVGPSDRCLIGALLPGRSFLTAVDREVWLGEVLALCRHTTARNLVFPSLVSRLWVQDSSAESQGWRRVTTLTLAWKQLSLGLPWGFPASQQDQHRLHICSHTCKSACGSSALRLETLQKSSLGEEWCRKSEKWWVSPSARILPFRDVQESISQCLCAGG